MVSLYSILFGLNTIILIANARIEFRQNSPFSLFWIAFFFNYFIYTMFDWGEYIFQGTSKLTPVLVSHDILVSAQSFIFLFNVMAFIYLCTSNLKFKNFTRRKLHENGIELIAIFIIAAFVFRMMFKYYSGAQNLDFSGLRDSASISGLLLDTYFKYVFVGTIVYFSFIGRQGAALGLLVLLLLDFVLFGGGRQFLLIALVGIASAYVISRGYPFSAFFLIFALIPIGTMLAKILVFLRNLPGLEARINFISTFDWGLVQRSTSNEYDLRFAFYHFIERYHELPDAFLSFKYLGRILLFWLPNSLSLGLKADDFEYDMYAYYFGQHGGSLHATFFGTIFADSGWFFLPWLVLYIAVREISGRIHFQNSVAANVIIWFGLAYLSLMWARGSIYAPLVVNLFILFVLYAMARLQGFFHQPAGQIKRLNNNATGNS